MFLYLLFEKSLCNTEIAYGRLVGLSCSVSQIQSVQSHEQYHVSKYFQCTQLVMQTRNSWRWNIVTFFGNKSTDVSPRYFVIDFIWMLLFKLLNIIISGNTIPIQGFLSLNQMGKCFDLVQQDSSLFLIYSSTTMTIQTLKSAPTTVSLSWRVLNRQL